MLRLCLESFDFSYTPSPLALLFTLNFPPGPCRYAHEEGALAAAAEFAAFLVFGHRQLRRPPPLPAGRFFVSTERRPARSRSGSQAGFPLDSIVASTSDPPARPIRYRMQK
ncbi:hypothetical protein HRG_013594 [Hirsutella rhossiliensis]